MNYPETPKVKLTHTKSGGYKVDGKPITKDYLSAIGDEAQVAKKIIENSIWTISLPLMGWGVAEAEARKATLSCMKSQIERGGREWTNIRPAPNVNPEDIVLATWQLDCSEFSPDIIEHAIFACFLDDITGMAEAVTHCPEISKRFQCDPVAFWGRLSSYARQKSAGARWLLGEPSWVRFAVKYWIKEPAHAGIKLAPPVCLCDCSGP